MEIRSWHLFRPSLQDLEEGVKTELKSWAEHIEKLAGDETGPNGPKGRWWEKWVQDAQKSINNARNYLQNAGKKWRNCKTYRELEDLVGRAQRDLNELAEDLAREYKNRGQW